MNALVQQWLPALSGVVDQLTGATVADIGCGQGVSTILMAVFPIAAATAHATAHGVTNVRFEVARAQDFSGPYDFITCFDCLHDMGALAAAAAHMRQALESGGTWMVVEPKAGDRLEDNLNPIARQYYSASTMICVPTSLAQETGAALGAQAGETQLASVIRAGGLSKVQRAAQTP